MSYNLVLVYPESSKSYPDFIGPFDSFDEAIKFGESYSVQGMLEAYLDNYGGYAGYYVISPEDTIDPEIWMEDFGSDETLD